jgi:hypothetical protein
MIVDVRLVLDRDDVWRVKVEGRLVPRVGATSVPEALDQLALAIEGAAWLSRRAPLDELQDPHGALYGVPHPPGPTVVGDPNDGGRVSDSPDSARAGIRG